MAQEITEGLFSSLLTQQNNALQQPITLGRGAMSPMSAITQRITQSGEQLQGSVRRLFGQQTPEEAQAQQLQEIKIAYSDALLNTGIDPNTPEGLKAAGNKLIDNPNPNIQLVGHNLIKEAERVEASLASQRRKVQKEELDITEKVLKIRKDIEGGTDLAVTFQRAASALGLPIYQTLEEYSAPQRRAMEAYTKETGISTAAASRERKEEEKRALRQGMKIDAAFTTVQNLNDVIAQLEREEKEGGLSSAGLPGQLLSWIGGTKFKNLAESLKTIKANIGFDQLAFLKEASETGGALGQVSNFELESLQAVRGSLDQTQSPAQLLRNIKRVKETYGNYLRSVYNNPKVSREAKAEAKILMGRLGITDFRKTTEGSQLILKYDDANAKILMDSFGDAMRNLREDKGSSVVNQELNDNKYTTTDILKTVERKLIKEGRIKLKGQ